MKTLRLDAPYSLSGVHEAKHLGDFRARKVGARTLVTNDWGRHALLSKTEFDDFLRDRLPREGRVRRELELKGFLRGGSDVVALAARFASSRSHLFKGPALHIVVVTLRCNLKCVYCHSSVVDASRREFDMTIETARRSIDMIFESPNPNLMIEFQGGEPLMNWPVVEFAARYARRKNKSAKRRLTFMMVSNFGLLDDEKMKACADLGISL